MPKPQQLDTESPRTLYVVHLVRYGLNQLYVGNPSGRRQPLTAEQIDLPEALKDSAA